MTDVAREAGISVGSIYAYVDGKDALFELALVKGLGLPVDDTPFRARGVSKASSSLTTMLAKTFRWPTLEEALRQGRISPNQLSAIVDEQFTLFSEHRRLIWLLDRCAGDVAELSGFYQASLRGRCMADFASAMRLSMAGSPLSEEELIARSRALFEMIVWMAVHRHLDRLPPASSDEVARKATIDVVLLVARGVR